MKVRRNGRRSRRTSVKAKSSLSRIARKLVFKAAKKSRANVVAKKRLRGLAKKGTGFMRWNIPKTPLPAKFRTKLSYSTSQALDCNPANVTAILLQANSLYDFDYTNNMGNKQPWAFDTICGASAPYTSYRVISTAISYKVTMLTDIYAVQNTYSTLTSGTGSMYYGTYRNPKPCWVYHFPMATATKDAWMDTYSEYVKHPEVKRNMMLKAGDIVRRTVSGNMKRLFKDTNEDDAESRLSAAYNATPADVALFRIILANDDPSNSATFQVDVSAVFDVEFFNLDTVDITT